ncbi:vesicle transport protein USE1 isoform X2 [Cygnus olor]|nr:vesicle transport protein USE1 isoform X2 [Cygnus olor]
MLRELKKQSSKPAPELLNEYSRKVDFLKGLLEAEKLSSSTEKALANQFLAPGRTPTTTKERTPATKTVHLQTKARCTGKMRSELLGTVCFGAAASLLLVYRLSCCIQVPLVAMPLVCPRLGGESPLFLVWAQALCCPWRSLNTLQAFSLARCNLCFVSLSAFQDPLVISDSEELNIRKRKGLVSDEKQSAVELDAVLQHHQDMQEKLAEEMLSLARSLKNNTLAAQNVIKQDNQTLSHSLRMADQNFEKLKDESDRLEQHAKKSVNWLLWIMLIVVCFIFISMILFIRIFPKLK